MERGSSPWFYPKDDAFDEDCDEDREEVRVHSERWVRISFFNISLHLRDARVVDVEHLTHR